MVRRVPARERSHARSQQDLATATWIPVRCIVPSHGLPMAAVCRSATSRRSHSSRNPSRSTSRTAACMIDGHDVTTVIRTAAMDRASASVARLPSVRQVLVERQRALGAHGGIVMEGRDIGTGGVSGCGPEDLSRRGSGRTRQAPRDGSGASSQRRAGRCGRRRHGRARSIRHAPASHRRWSSPPMPCTSTPQASQSMMSSRRSWGWSGRIER